jgi:nucleoside-diphosphate-sugar epimerase/biotin carboxylase
MQNTNKIKVLITCVGGGVGQSVVDSLKNNKGRYHLVCSDSVTPNYGSLDCDQIIDLPKLSEKSYVPALVDYCEKLGIDIVIPGHDGEQVLFAEARKQFEAVGTTVMVSSIELVQLFRNKLEWAKYFRRHTDRVVMSASPKELVYHENSINFCFPAIAKPMAGSASAGLKIIKHSSDLIDIPEDYVIQEFLFPSSDDPNHRVVRDAVNNNKLVQISEISIQLLYSRDGDLIGKFGSRNKLKSGVPIEIVPIKEDESVVWDAVTVIDELLRPLRPSGPINLQGRLTDKGLVLFEMNPRFTGITGTRSLFGFNEVSLLVDCFIDGIQRKPRINFNKVGFRQVACRAASHAVSKLKINSGIRDLNIVVLGGTSWLGRALVSSLESRAPDELVLVTRNRSLAQAKALYAGKSCITVLSAEDPGLDDVFGWCDVLINLVSGRPPSGNENIEAAFTYQSRMLSRAFSTGVPLVVNVSSQSVYGPDEEPWKEESKLHLSEPYSFSKYAIEQYLESFKRVHPSTKTLSLRFSRLFGPCDGLRVAEFPHKVVQSFIQGTDIQVTNSETVFDLLDIRDAVGAIEHVLLNDVADQGVLFNVGSSAPLTAAQYKNLCATVWSEITDDSKINEINEYRLSPVVSGGYLDCTKFLKTGWTKKISTSDSVKDLFSYIRSIQC